VISGHRDGTRLTHYDECNAYIAQVTGTAPPNFQVVYKVLGVTLTIEAIRIV